ncbi:MAG: hypothetical protein V7L21_31375 [Nostoc sp.]|uniref:hypothetical protein n=1 Tax=Nostoc sp. TaxID=1180 RepID=UPI002FF8C98B
MAIDDSLIHYLFPNLKLKHCYEQTFPDGVIGAMSTTGYDAGGLATASLRDALAFAIGVAISVAHQEQYWGNTNRIYVEEIS